MNIVDKIEWKENYLDAIIVHMNNINENFSKQLLFSLKPGGHIITINDKIKYHRNTIALEDMGFEIRDQIIWFFGNDNKSLCLGRKPLSEKTIVDNVVKWGTGGINVDVCRIEIEGKDDRSAGIRTANFGSMEYQSGGNGTEPYEPNEGGRFPANILFDETAAEMLDQQSGISDYSKKKNQDTKGFRKDYVGGDMNDDSKKISGKWPADKGGASRFFYVTKSNQDLIDYLTKLITPENGTILIYSKT